MQLAEDYVAHLQTGERVQAVKTFNELSALHGQQNESLVFYQGLYQEIGKLTRKLHESINNFMQDPRMKMMVSEDFPDARQGLDYVIELTEQSAHETLSAVENSSPIVAVLQKKSSEIQRAFNLHIQSKENSDSLGDLAEELDAFLQLVSNGSKEVADDLNVILMSQSTQDLTGQIIKRVSTLVHEVEQNLLIQLQLGGEKAMQADAECHKEDKKNNSGHGPAVPGTRTGDVVHSQEEVDDLLSSLGF